MSCRAGTSAVSVTRVAPREGVEVGEREREEESVAVSVPWAVVVDTDVGVAGRVGEGREGTGVGVLV